MLFRSSPMVGGLVPSSPTVYSRPTPQRVRRGASEGWPGAREAAPNRGAGLTAVLLSSAQIPFRTAFPTVTEVHPLGSGRGSEEMRLQEGGGSSPSRPVPSRPVPSRPRRSPAVLAAGIRQQPEGHKPQGGVWPAPSRPLGHLAQRHRPLQARVPGDGLAAGVPPAFSRWRVLVLAQGLPWA